MKTYRLKHWYPGLPEEWEEGRLVVLVNKTDPDYVSKDEMKPGSVPREHVENYCGHWEEVRENTITIYINGYKYTVDEGDQLWTIGPVIDHDSNEEVRNRKPQINYTELAKDIAEDTNIRCVFNGRLSTNELNFSIGGYNNNFFDGDLSESELRKGIEDVIEKIRNGEPVTDNIDEDKLRFVARVVTDMSGVKCTFKKVDDGWACFGREGMIEWRIAAANPPVVIAVQLYHSIIEIQEQEKPDWDIHAVSDGGVVLKDMNNCDCIKWVDWDDLNSDDSYPRILFRYAHKKYEEIFEKRRAAQHV